MWDCVVDKVIEMINRHGSINIIAQWASSLRDQLCYDDDSI